MRRPHAYMYALLILGSLAVVLLLFQGLTERVNRAEDAAEESRTAATTNARSLTDAQSAVGQLARQVKRLGGDPVITPEKLPTPVVGPAGAVGQQGQRGNQGIAGPRGPAGRTGATGSPGTAGSNGSNGKDGSAGSNGTDGPAGSKGEQGPKGEPGDPGPTGPPGPAGADGHDGATGATGPQGPPGPTCPDGYTGEDLTVITPQGGTRDIFACTASGSVS